MSSLELQIIEVTIDNVEQVTHDLLDIDALAELLQFSVSKTWDEVKKEDFPILLKFDDGTTRWLRHEVYAWMVMRIEKAKEAGRAFVAERGWGQALADEDTSEKLLMPDDKQKKSTSRRAPRRATRLKSFHDDLPDKLV